MFKEVGCVTRARDSSVYGTVTYRDKRGSDYCELGNPMPHIARSTLTEDSTEGGWVVIQHPLGPVLNSSSFRPRTDKLIQLRPGDHYR